jgi:hypothetical protein
MSAWAPETLPRSALIPSAKVLPSRQSAQDFRFHGLPEPSVRDVDRDQTSYAARANVLEYSPLYLLLRSSAAHGVM